MSKKFSVLELPLYRDYFHIFIEILEKLDEKLQKETKHKILIKNTYDNVIEIFTNLNAGYNHWGTKGKLQLYNKVRILLSKIQTEIYFLAELKLFEKDYFIELENSIKYVGGLIKKIETMPN